MNKCARCGQTESMHPWLSDYTSRGCLKFVPEHRVWIDTDTGTWGTGKIVTVDLSEVCKQDGYPDDQDEYSLYAALDSMTDSEIIAFGKRYGGRGYRFSFWLGRKLTYLVPTPILRWWVTRHDDQ